MLKIWGRANSINVQKVLWCAAELGLEFERTDVGGPFGGTDTNEYRAMNPMGLIPTIVDGETTLWESHTCIRYLVAKHDTGNLWQHNIAARAESEKWMDWVLTTVNRPMTTIFKGLIRTPEAERNLDEIEKAKETMGRLWAIADERLADQNYLASTQFTIADLALGPYAYRFFGLFGKKNELSNVVAWYDRLTSREGFCTHVMQPMT